MESTTNHAIPPNSVLSDADALQVQELWKQSFPDAAVLPVIGFPSNSGGVITLTHSMGDGQLLKINGLPSKSPLSNNALYSSEISEGQYLNLYEIMIPDYPGTAGRISSAQVYINALHDVGLDVAGVHFHWNGAYMDAADKNVVAVHHQNVGLTPLEFSQRTIRALNTVMPLLHQMSGAKGTRAVLTETADQTQYDSGSPRSPRSSRRRRRRHGHRRREHRRHHK
jgi:hypothetical protein